MGTASDGFKGVCLILNYFQYTAEKVVDEDGKITETVNQNRYGTMKDADDLKKLFTKLQFKVLLCNDLSRKETRKKLKEGRLLKMHFDKIKLFFFTMLTMLTNKIFSGEFRLFCLQLLHSLYSRPWRTKL